MPQSQFLTVETGDDIIRQLYRRDPETEVFPVTMTAVLPRVEFVEDKPLTVTLLVERLGDAPATYVHPNRQHVFETRAYIENGGEPFTISLTLPIGDSHLQGAEVTTPQEMEEIIIRWYLRDL